MKIRIDAPSKIEAEVAAADDNGFSVRPVASDKQASVRVCYLTVTGDGGAESRAMVLCNTSTGKFHIKNVRTEKPSFEFDKLTH